MQHDNIQIYSMTGVVPSQDSFGTLKDGTKVSRYGLYVVILSELQITIELCFSFLFYLYLQI